MRAHTTSSSADGQLRTRAGRGRGVVISALTAALFTLSAGAAAASPVETPLPPQHLSSGSLVPQEAVGAACEGLDVAPSLPVTGELQGMACQNVNGWQ